MPYSEYLQDLTGPMFRRLLTPLSRNFPTVGIIALLATLFVYFRALEAARTTSDSLRPAALRSRVADQLVGQAMPALDLETLDGARSDLNRREEGVVWLIDPSECSACLSSLPKWLDLLRESGVAGFLVLTGGGSTLAASRLISRYSAFQLEPIIVVDSASISRSLLQLPLPSTKILVHHGKVVLADARSDGMSCGWDFETVAETILNRRTR